MSCRCGVEIKSEKGCGCGNKEFFKDDEGRSKSGLSPVLCCLVIVGSVIFVAFMLGIAISSAASKG